GTANTELHGEYNSRLLRPTIDSTFRFLFAGKRGVFPAFLFLHASPCTPCLRGCHPELVEGLPQRHSDHRGTQSV
ncbi:MAG TPA: hypothetical protein VGQ53_22145, partial [Chitinophagaceae bacterium]|nr:hypothetical protein [Chitinophagaceae bacterium]